jgi:hypothetical protein
VARWMGKSEDDKVGEIYLGRMVHANGHEEDMFVHRMDMIYTYRKPEKRITKTFCMHWFEPSAGWPFVPPDEKTRAKRDMFDRVHARRKLGKIRTDAYDRRTRWEAMYG